MTKDIREKAMSLQRVQEALEYAEGYVRSAVVTEMNDINCDYRPLGTTLRHHNLIIEAIKDLKEYTERLESGEVSDGHHTFNELYEHRHTLFASLICHFDIIGWKSLKHDDGTMFDGWFIAGMNLPSGCVTYHIPIRLWDLYKCKELPNAPKWDGHTSDDVIKRFTAAIKIIKG